MTRPEYWPIRASEEEQKIVRALGRSYGIDPEARGGVAAIVRQALHSEYARLCAGREKKSSKHTQSAPPARGGLGKG